MNHENDNFILKVYGYQYDPTSGPLHKTTGIIEYFSSLNDAFERLQQFDEAIFFERLVERNNRSFGINIAFILTATREKLVTKREMFEFDDIGISDGLYLHITTKNISPEEFKAQTGVDLNGFNRINNTGFFLMATFDEVAKRTQRTMVKSNSRKRLPGNRKMRPGSGKGLAPS